MAKIYNHFISVRSKDRDYQHPFPIDMLRYDQIYPVSQTDSEKILKTLNSGTFHVGEIDLTKKGPKSWAPTYKRWESFGWIIATHEVE